MVGGTRSRRSQCRRVGEVVTRVGVEIASIRSLLMAAMGTQSYIDSDRTQYPIVPCKRGRLRRGAQ